MSFFQIFLIVFPVFIPILIGFILVHTNILHQKDAKVLTTFFMYVALPALIIHLFSQVDIVKVMNGDFLIAMLLGTVIVFMIALLSYHHFLKKSLQVSAMAALTASYVNAGIVGLPILLLVIPESIAVITVIIDGIVTLMIMLPFVLILLNLSGKDKKHTHLQIVIMALKRAFMSPIIISTIIGTIISIFRIPLPNWLNTSLSSLSQATFAVALVAVGMSFHISSIKKNLNGIELLALIKLVVAPFVALCLAAIFNLTPDFALALVVILGLPTAKATFIISEEYNLLVEQTAGMITMTTLVGIFVIPVLIYISKAIW